jgi:hypothetical protein
MRFTQHNIRYILLVYKYVLQYNSGSDSIPFSSLNTIQNNFSLCQAATISVTIVQLYLDDS